MSGEPKTLTPPLTLDVAFTEDRNALTVHPMHLLTLLGEFGCALRFNPGGDDPMDPFDSPEQWEVYDVDNGGGNAYLMGAGPTATHALIDAAIIVIGFDQETDELGFDFEKVTPEHRDELRRAHNVLGELLNRELRSLAGGENEK